jgi:hypothetical protein
MKIYTMDFGSYGAIAVIEESEDKARALINSLRPPKYQYSTDDGKEPELQVHDIVPGAVLVNNRGDLFWQ